MILDQIIRHKRRELKALKRIKPLADLRKAARALPRRRPRFSAALEKTRTIAVIAEIKRRSPSQGNLRREFSPVKLAKAYLAGGARALSVLTDRKYFGGTARDLAAVRKAVNLPILRKDFTVDEYQIYESRLLGADAILLIASVLSLKKIRRFSALAGNLGLDALIEVHTEAELEKVLRLRPKLIGINNRDLRNFRVDITTTRKLACRLPKKCILISESGITDREDLRFLRTCGVKAVLVGESLLKKKDVAAALRGLRGVKNG